MAPLWEINYASGTRNLNSRSWNTFDQLYPSSHDQLGLADQVGWRNVKQVRTGVEEFLNRHWKLRQTYENFWLNSAYDGLYGSSGGLVTRSASGTAGKHVGQEIDFWAEFTWNKSIKGGCGYAHFFTGEFLNRTTPGRDYNYPYIFLDYKL